MYLRHPSMMTLLLIAWDFGILLGSMECEGQRVNKSEDSIY